MKPWPVEHEGCSRYEHLIWHYFVPVSWHDRRVKRVAVAIIMVGMFAVGCSGGDANDSPQPSASTTTITVTPQASSASAAPTNVPPSLTPTTVAEKEISWCGITAEYEPGTTFYTDGSNGWTQYCEDEFYAANPPQISAEPPVQCEDGAVVNEGGGNYSTCQNGSWTYVAPTFDPDSGDGYGPNQPLPPLCVRFPDQYTC